MNLDIPNTWKLQAAAGFKYDATFGFRDRIGFKSGRLLPFRPLNNNFIVIPLTIMDGAVFNNWRTPEKALKRCVQLLEYAQREGALMTVLWHQRVFNQNEFPGWAEVYEKIIQEGYKRKAYFCRCRDIFELYKNR
jgi:hypothetical protein